MIEPEGQAGRPTGQHQGAGDGHEPAAEHDKPAAEHGGGKTAAPAHGGRMASSANAEIVIQEELDDIYVIKSGLSVTDKIIFEGIRQVRDGDTVEYELQPATEILKHLKYHAE